MSIYAGGRRCLVVIRGGADYSYSDSMAREFDGARTVLIISGIRDLRPQQGTTSIGSLGRRSRTRLDFPSDRASVPASQIRTAALMPIAVLIKLDNRLASTG